MASVKDRLLHPLTRELPAHTAGVREGNAMGSYEQQPGHRPDDTSTAARSTGVNPERQNPIDPRSPNLSPP